MIIFQFFPVLLTYIVYNIFSVFLFTGACVKKQIFNHLMSAKDYRYIFKRIEKKCAKRKKENCQVDASFFSIWALTTKRIYIIHVPTSNSILFMQKVPLTVDFKWLKEKIFWISYDWKVVFNVNDALHTYYGGKLIALFASTSSS